MPLIRLHFCFVCEQVCLRALKKWWLFECVEWWIWQEFRTALLHAHLDFFVSFEFIMAVCHFCFSRTMQIWQELFVYARVLALARRGSLRRKNPNVFAHVTDPFLIIIIIMIIITITHSTQSPPSLTSLTHSLTLLTHLTHSPHLASHLTSLHLSHKVLKF